jgi:hypothetical protein
VVAPDGVIDATALLLTVTVTGAETAVHELKSVMVTVKIPLLETVILWVVALLLQR